MKSFSEISDDHFFLAEFQQFLSHAREEWQARKKCLPNLTKKNFFPFRNKNFPQ